jgi:DNA processing protein
MMLSPMDDADFRVWFRLLETPGLGRASVRVLLAACGSPQGVFDARPETLRSLVGPAAATALGQVPAGFDARLEAAQRWRSGGPARHVLTLGDAAYPPSLLATADPPLLLYVQGDPAWLLRPAVAIVGSRHATAQGLDNARAFGRALAEQGWVVVSGLALGIDGAAHEGALQAGPDSHTGTVAVVGTGLDRVYPQAHRDLAQRIAAQGALVSEYAPGMPPLGQNFPLRNRIIAGLSQGTLVVEAALRSGSLVSARLAMEAGREVFAIPGSIHAPQSRGCHALIKQGAKLVESATDITEELRGQVQPALAADPGADDDAGEAATGPDAPLLAALGHDPTTLDALQARTGWPTPELSARLLDLELDGQVARLPGGLYQRRTRL